METIKKINGLKGQILEKVTISLIHLAGQMDDYEIVWKQLQDITANLIKDILQEEFPFATITIPTSKSTYPDIKLETEEGLFAIDIKTNESSKNPWFDMARLDTIAKERFGKYQEEWELVIKYDSHTKVFLKAYFLLFREAVGIRTECDGVKYRPYDGKIRPKSWDDFEQEVVYWQSKNDFKKGIRKSLLYRWKTNIKQHLLPILSEEEKQKFKSLFE